MAFYDRIKHTISNTPGTGSGFTVNAASSGFRTPATASIPNATAAVLLITEGTAWEICNSVYTSGTTSWSRGSLIASSTGAAVNFTSAAIVGIDSAAHQIVDKTGDTMTGKLTTLATASGGAGLTLPHGTAPSAPVDGDLWTTSAGGLYVRINGVTVGPFAVPALTFASSTTLSTTAAANFTINSSAKNNIFMLRNVVPATDNTQIFVLASIDSGANYTVSLSKNASHMTTTLQDQQEAGVTTGVGMFNLGVGSAANEWGLTCQANFSQPSSQYGQMHYNGGFVDASGLIIQAQGSILLSTTSTITNIQFKAASGNLETGFIDHYYLT